MRSLGGSFVFLRNPSLILVTASPFTHSSPFVERCSVSFRIFVTSSAARRCRPGPAEEFSSCMCKGNVAEDQEMLDLFRLGKGWGERVARKIMSRSSSAAPELQRGSGSSRKREHRDSSLSPSHHDSDSLDFTPCSADRSGSHRSDSEPLHVTGTVKVRILVSVLNLLSLLRARGSQSSVNRGSRRGQRRGEGHLRVRAHAREPLPPKRVPSSGRSAGSA
jgi:hypothetical protein